MGKTRQERRLGRTYLSRFAILGMGVVLACLLAEILLRVFTPNVLEVGGRVRAAAYLEDALLGWKLKPNFSGVEEKKEFRVRVQTNEHGFRDDSYDEIDFGPAFRILGVGDSFTYGSGVEHEETYLELLEGYLNSSRPEDREYRVFNTGVGGYSLKEYSVFLTNHWKKFDPDLIVIGITSNDHTDIKPYPKMDVAYGYLIEHQAVRSKHVAIDPETGLRKRTMPASVVVRLKIFLHEHLYLYRLLGIVKRELGARRQTEEGENESIRREVDDAWKRASERLDQIRDLAQDNDIGLVLVFIPHRKQVHPGLMRDAHIISRYFDDLDRRLDKYCRENDIPFINLLPCLIERAQRGETLYYLETDAHWNPSGHELAARVIYGFLIQELLAKEDI